MQIYGYHRTSTKEQHLDRGIQEIERYCNEHEMALTNIFTDQETGKNFNRPRYTVLVEDVLRPGDILIVTELDRLGRNKYDTIHHISFTAHHGQTVALIGATGCGKSSIINLIPRLYDATSGQVLVDGVDVRDYTQDALRSKIGFVPQKAFLFSGTVSSNVGYGEDNASGAAIRKAVAIAQAAEFVESPEVGYSGTVAQGGSNFSGGQKQRLSIARAVARDPEILVFDDSFSALDYKTDHALRQALREQTSGTTNIIVAQRIGTIRDADCILVIEDGAIVGKGTHRELMESCKVYQEIAYSQLSKEELAS